MPVTKYIDRLKRMDDLIRRKATGTPEEFADRMEMDRSTVLRYLSELRKLDAPIVYDPIQQTYLYEEEVRLLIGFRKISSEAMQAKTGGYKYFPENTSVSKYATETMQVCVMFNI